MAEALTADATEHGEFRAVFYDTFQAGFSASGGGEFNNNEDVLKFVVRLRTLTRIPGNPSLLVAFHPVKRATEADLVPYGGGAILNEIDGNLTLWGTGRIKLAQNRVRGPEFEPAYFQIEKRGCPGILDICGQQVEMPVCTVSSAAEDEDARIAENKDCMTLLRAIYLAPGGSQRERAKEFKFSLGKVNALTQRLKAAKLLEQTLGQLSVTAKGSRAVNTD